MVSLICSIEINSINLSDSKKLIVSIRGVKVDSDFSVCRN